MSRARGRAIAQRRREPGPWWPWLALAFLTLLCFAAYGQTVPSSPPAAAPPGRATTPGTGAPPSGVLRPPSEIDPGMKVAPPASKTGMPVIRPRSTTPDGTVIVPK